MSSLLGWLTMITICRQRIVQGSLLTIYYTSIFFDFSTENLMELYGVSNALDAFQFVLSHGNTFLGEDFENDQDHSNDYRKQVLINLLRNYYDRRDLTNLFIEFYIFFDVYLYFIGFKQYQFGLINDYLFPNGTKQRKIAYVVLNGNGTICGPLFAHGPTGKQTVFTHSDMSIATEVDKYIEKLNRTGNFLRMKTISIHFLIDPSLIPLTKECSPSTTNPDVMNDSQQITNVRMDMLVNDHSALINGVNSGNSFCKHHC